MADNQYKIQLGVDVDVSDIQSQINTKATKIDKIPIKIEIENLNDIKKQIQGLGDVKTNKGLLKFNTESLEASLKDVSTAIKDIKASLGSLDDKSGMKSLLSSVNQIATALGKVENESDSLLKSLSALGKKDFSINLGIDMGKKNNNMIAYGRTARKQIIPELEAQIKELEGLFGGQQATMSKLAKHGSKVGFDVFTDFGDFNSDSAIKKMEAMEKYINSLKKLASIDNVKLDGFNEVHKNATELINDITGVEDAVDKAGDVPEKIKKLFGGSLDVEGLAGQLQPIITDLDEIKTAIQGLSSSNSIDGLTQSFNRLSETLEKLTANLALAKNTLDTGFSNASPANNAVKVAQQTGQKIGETISKSAKQSINLDDVIDEQVLRLMNEYAISGKNSSKAFDEIRQSLVDFRNGSGDINKVTSAISNNMKVVNEAKNDYKELADHIKMFNASGAKVHIPDSIRQEYGDDYKSMRSQLGKAFTSGKGMDFETFIEETNSILGQTIDLSHGAEAAFGDLVNKVNSTKGDKILTGDDLFRNGVLDMGDVVANISTSLEQIENAEGEIARTSTAAANTVVQNEERKQRAYRDTVDIIQKVSKISPSDAQLVNIMSSNIENSAQKAGIDLEDYYHSLQHINAFQPTNADVALIADVSESIVNRLGVDVYSDYIKKMREIAGVNGQIVEAINSSEKEIAQASTQDANIVVQSEERKQQAYRETANVVQRQSRLISDSAQNAINNVSSERMGKHFIVDPTDSNAFNNEMKNLVRQWTDGKGNLVDVKIDTRTVYDKETQSNVERLHQAQVTYNNDLGETIKKTIAWRQIGTEFDDNGKPTKAIRGFVEVAGQYSKTLGKTKTQTDTFLKQQKQAVANLTNQINQLNRSAIDQNASRPIKDTSHLDTLKTKYNEITSAIQRMENASTDTFVDEQNNVKALISDYKSLVSEYKNAENVSSKMKGTDFTSGLDIAKNDLEKFKAQAKDFPQITQTIENLDKAIEGVGDASSLNKFNDQLRVARSELAKIKSETTAVNRSEKVGINVSGLESKIADLQRISPEIDKFESEIDGAKVSVQSLLNDLKQVNTQSDFSVVNSKWKAFTDAAKAAGIAVTETATKARIALANDIKFNIDVGNFDNEMDTMIAKFNSLSETNDDLRRSYDATKDAYKAMMDAANANTGDEVADRERLIQAEKEYAAALEKTNNLIKQQARADKIDADSQRLADSKEALKLDMVNWLRKNTKAAKEYGGEINKLIASLDKLDEVGVKGARRQFNNLDKAADSRGLKGLTTWDKLIEKAKEYATYISAAEVFMYAEQALTSMFEQVKLIDTAMTELKKVTDETDASYNQFLSNAATRAKELGTTIDGLVESTAEFARLGYGFEEAQGLAEVANIYAVVGDEIEGVEGATKSLVSTLAAFKDQASGISDTDFAMDIVDKFNEVKFDAS